MPRRSTSHSYGIVGTSRAKRILNMTMLMHTCGPFERGPSSTAKRDTIGDGAVEARLATIKRLCIGALTVLAACGALAAIIALKAAIYYWRFLH
jgi:hypothetical protein